MPHSPSDPKSEKLKAKSLEAAFSLTNKTRGKIPNAPFDRIKNTVLGKQYELSLAFIAPAEARRITEETKHADHASNVLSFPLSKNSGEILICPATARAQAAEYGMAPQQFLIYLFIHGLLHLKGMPHGGTMESEESRIMQLFASRIGSVS